MASVSESLRFPIYKQQHKKINKRAVVEKLKHRYNKNYKSKVNQLAYNQNLTNYQDVSFLETIPDIFRLNIMAT